MSMLNMWANGRSHFWPQGYNLNNLGRGRLDKAVYQIANEPSGFRQEAF